MFTTLSKHQQYFYIELSKMIKRIETKKSSIKNEVFKSNYPRRFQGVLNKIIINYNVLSEIVEKSEFIEDIDLGCAIVYDTINGKIKNEEYRRQFEEILGNRKLKEVRISKYIRLNGLKGMTIEKLKGIKLNSTMMPDVYEIVNANDYKKIFNDKKIKNNIKVQNIISCIPAHVLNPEENSVVIDGTAAPGNKTTQLATIMKNTGKIYAIEKSKSRFETMVKLLKEYGVTNVEAINDDFLKFEKREVDYVMLDPSCSGSGIHHNYRKDQTRIDILHNFQCVMIKHGLNFSPKKLVYSTCSVHEEEGEQVIKEALEEYPNYEVEDISKYFTSPGIPGYKFSDKVIRTERTETQVGFFIALLRKKL